MPKLFTAPRGWLRTASSRFPKPAAMRYAIIGATAFVIDIGLLNVGLLFGLSLLMANAVAVVVAIVYSFVLHRTITFAHDADKDSGYKMRRRHQFFVFVIVSLIALLLNEALMGLLVHSLEMQPNPAKIITSLILFIWNYQVNRRITFKTNQ